MIRGGIAQEQDGMLFRHGDDAIFVPWDAPPALHMAAYRTLLCMERLPLDFDPTKLTHASDDDSLWFNLLAVALKGGHREDCTIYPADVRWEYVSLRYWYLLGGWVVLFLIGAACLIWG